MKSTIRVKHDYDLNEPYLQLRLEGYNEDDADGRDENLKNFVETANNSLLYIFYGGAGSGLPQIRVLNRDKTPEELVQLVIQNFETFAHKFFQLEELQYCDSFFQALKVKASLKSSIKRPSVHPGPHSPEYLGDSFISKDSSILSKEEEFKKAAMPLMNHLMGYSPKVYATVDSGGAMLIEELQTITRSEDTIDNSDK